MFPWNLFPFDENMKNKLKNLNPNEIEKFTQELIEKMLPGQLDGIMNPHDLLKGRYHKTSNSPDSTQPTPLQPSIFETHKHVYVRVPINSEEWIQQMKIFHTSNLIIIEHIPKINDKHTFPLPAIVKRKGATANYKDGILEIQLLKNEDMQFCEIDVKESH